MVQLFVTIIRKDKFKLFEQSVVGIKIKEISDNIDIILTYDNGYDETITVKKKDIKDIETKLEVL